MFINNSPQIIYISAVRLFSIVDVIENIFKQILNIEKS